MKDMSKLFAWLAIFLLATTIVFLGFLSPDDKRAEILRREIEITILQSQIDSEKQFRQSDFERLIRLEKRVSDLEFELELSKPK